MRSHTVALCNQKGGVGKTTTTYHLARAASRAELRTLAIDLDPQGNLTQALAAEPVAKDDLTIADALSSRVSDVSLTDVLVAGLWPGVTLAPATTQPLASVRDELVTARMARETTLQRTLTGAGERYDLTLIDCPPDLSQLTINALVAADTAVLVTAPGLFSSEGLAEVLDTLDTIRTHYNPTLVLAGVLLNGYDERRVTHRDRYAELRDAGITLLDPPMPRRAAIQDACEAGRGLDHWPGGYPLADRYQQLLTTIQEAS